MSIDYSVVLDSNERKRMLEDGYQPDVIDFIAKDRYESMRNEFTMKKVVLNQHYEQLSPVDFVEEVFPGVDQLMVVTAEDTYVRFFYAGNVVDVPMKDAMISERDDGILYRSSVETYIKHVSEI